jgi:hypothetical protein
MRLMSLQLSFLVNRYQVSLKWMSDACVLCAVISRARSLRARLAPVQIVGLVGVNVFK